MAVFRQHSLKFIFFIFVFSGIVYPDAKKRANPTEEIGHTILPASAFAIKKTMNIVDKHKGSRSTLVTLSVTLNGCFDNLGPVFYYAKDVSAKNAKNHSLTLYIHGLNIINPKSLVAMCFAPKVKDVTLTIKGFLKAEDIRLQNLSVAHSK